MPALWPDSVDEVLGGDHAVILAYATPAKGVVLLPVSNFAVRDRAAGTVSPNSSVGAWRKLERMRRDPHVAVAYHTRTHADNDRSEYVLVQGRADLQPPDPDYPNTILPNWERMEPGWSRLGPLWRRWLKTYRLRVEIRIAAERLVVWPDLDCRGEAEVIGTPLPEQPPEPQKPPGKGTGPRVDQAKAAERARKLPEVLLGWIGADGFPMVVAVTVAGSEPDGIVLEAPPGLVPPGGRRAGLTAHWFSRGVIGQNQRKHTGWMESDPATGRILYAPHTDSSYRFPSSHLLFRVLSGGFMRWGLRSARRAGFDPST